MPVITEYDPDNGVVVSVFSEHATLWDLKEDAVISFFESTLIGQGWTIRTFSERQATLDWLLEKA